MKQWWMVLLSCLLAAPVLAGEDPDATAAAAPGRDELIALLEKRLSAVEESIQKLEGAMVRQQYLAEAQQRFIAEGLAKSPSGRGVKTAGGGAQVEAPPVTLRWDRGLVIEDKSQAVKIKMGGRVMYDFTWASEDDALRADIGTLEDGAELRRGRFYTAGVLYENVLFKLQFDWAGGETALKDAYVGLNDLPVGTLLVGHMHEPFGFGELISSKYGTFMERAPMLSAFAPERNAGIRINKALRNQTMTVAAGAFRETDSRGRTTAQSDYGFTARITGTPFYNEQDTRLVHLGAAASWRHKDDTARFHSRPPIHFVPNFVDTRVETTDPATGETTTEDLAADDLWLYGLEAAVVYESFHAQAEFAGADVDRAGEDYQPYGAYVQAGYFLTGEVRPYKRNAGVFGAPAPNENFGKGGWGAWELAARYDFLDLSENDVEGGELTDVTVGLNWYLNPLARVMFDYVYSDLRDSGQANLAGARLQVAF